MLLPQLRPRQTADKGNGSLDSRGFQLLHAQDQFLSGFSFLDHIQHFLTAGFRAKIYHRQPMRAQLPQFLVGLAQRILRASVGSHALTFRKSFRDRVQNSDQLVICQTERVAVTEKNSLYTPIMRSRPVEILQNLVHIPDAELFLLIHIAEGALIMRTANGDLYQQAVSLAGRSVNIAFVSHDCISPLIVIFPARLPTPPSRSSAAKKPHPASLRQRYLVSASHLSPRIDRLIRYILSGASIPKRASPFLIAVLAAMTSASFALLSSSLSTKMCSSW